MNTLPTAWSYSALKQLLGVCGLQFRFERIEKQEPDALAVEPIVGSCLHHVHAYARHRQRSGEPIHVDDLRAVFTESWALLTQDPRVQVGDPARELNDGLKLVDLLHANLSQEEILGIEEDFEIPLLDADGTELPRPLVGVMDLVVRDTEGRVVVVDLKTAASRYPDSRCRTDLQATTYLLAASHLYGGPLLFRWDLVVKKVRPTFERLYTTRGADDFRRLIALVKTADRLVEAGIFVPADAGSAFFCAGCGYKKSCAAWAATFEALPIVAAKVPA